MRTRLVVFIETLAIAVVYFFSARLGLSFALEVPQVSAVWPPSGIALAALLIFGLRYWPGIALGSFLTCVLYPVPVYAALGIAAGHTVEAVAGAYVLRRVGFAASLERVRDIAALVFLAGIPCAAIAPAINTSILSATGVFPANMHFPMFLRGWVGDATGIWGVTPLLLTWRTRPLGTDKRRFEAFCVLASTGLLAYFTILYLESLKYLLFPLLAWSAVRLGQRRTATACFLITAIAILGARLGSAAFVQPGEHFEDSLGRLMLFSGATSLTALLLGAVVAERQRAAHELHIKSEQLKLALEAGRVGIWEWDVRTGAIKWSDNLTAIHCLSAAEAPSTIAQYLATVYPDDRKILEESILQSYREEQFQTEYRSPRADGTMAWYAGRGVLVRDPYGSPERLIGVCADISERKRAEEELRRTSAELERLVAARTRELRDSEQRLRLLVDQVPAILFTFDPNLRLTSAFGSGLRLLGINAEELIGRTSAEIADADTAAVRKDNLQRAIAGESRSYETQFRGRCLSVHIDPLRNENGAVIGIIGLAFDVTERKHAEALLAEETRRKDEFLAVLAHELRNPLAPIRNAVEVLQRLGAHDPRMQRACEIITRQVKHMVNLVDDLLDVARISHGKILLRKERLDLIVLLRSVIDEHRSDIDAHGLQIEPDLPPGPVWVDGDETRITQVFDNLLHNAVKFTPPGGRVTIKVAVDAAEHAARISVTDTGIGMEPATLNTLFEPFAQADQSLARSAGGLGLGLALSRQLLALHGARIEAFSAGIGQGSEFRVWFPLADVPPATVNHRAPVKSNTAGLKIEIVEDNLDAAESLRLLLEVLGHSVNVAHDARAGLELARRFQPDVVLCDIGLPQGMSGYDFAMEFRRDPAMSQGYLIALTGYGQEKDVRRALDSGFNAHLTKPVGLEDLQHVLARESRTTFSP